MNSQLDHFCSLFKNENDLQHHLVELLGKMKGITGVRRLQGTNERGKDIVFYYEAPFGRKRLQACVVKNTVISGSVSAGTGARTVLFQAQQAFDTPYSSGAGFEEQVEHVLVISPFPASPDAFESIKGALQHRAGQVTFLCGNDLLDAFKRDWPDFLAFEGDFLGRYLNDLRLQLEANPVMAALALRHSIVEPATQLLTEVYVPQRLSAALHEFKQRSLSWYTDLLTSKVSMSEIEDAAFNLNILAGVLTNARLWYSNSITTSPTAAKTLRNVGSRLPALWEAAYRALYLKYEEHTPSRNIAEVYLAVKDPSEVEQYTIALRDAKKHWEALGALLAGHRPRVRRIPHTLLGIILDPIYPLHCALVEAANRSPLAIEKTALLTTKDMDSHMFAAMSHSIVITAPAGFGKTSYCKYHALCDAERLLKHQGKILPVYVPLHQIADSPINAFGDLLLHNPQLRNLLESPRSEAVPFGRVRLYLDGLDEVANTAQRRRIMSQALTASLAWPVQVIVTARDYVYDDYLAVLPRVQLCGFNQSERDEIVSRWLKVDSLQISAFDSEVDKHPSLGELLSVPLLATLITGVFRKTSRLPGTKIELFEMCVDMLCGGWDLVKNVQRPGRFARHTKLTVLKTLAGQMHTQGMRHAKLEDVQVALRLSATVLEDNPTEILEEILQDGLLIRNGRVFLFSHFSFQEYLAAKSLVDPKGQKQVSALKRYLLGDDWWKEVIAYYVGLLDSPHIAHEWISGVAQGMLRSAQNSVQSEVRRRCNILEQTLERAYPLFRALPLLK